MDRKKLTLGYDDFKEVMIKNLYYVDKTDMIREFLDSNGKVVLITRPRRFGKTLNLSMIRRFFEDERTSDGERIDNGGLFDGLAISKSGEPYLQYQEKYPVISLSLKEAKQENFDDAYLMIRKQISAEFRRHDYVLRGDALTENDRENFRQIAAMEDDGGLYLDALQFLSECLYRYHGQNAYILIDEYDVPLETAYVKGFYDRMIGFIRSLFGSALKGNPYLEKGIITGCLRISRESIFTGLNNLEVHSILSNYYSSSFGFTEGEVRGMLAYYGLGDRFPEVREWYDGYRFGTSEIYNPWSIISYIKNALAADFLPRPYWSNTSSNSIVRELVEEADGETRKELETLMEGGTIEKPVHEEITYGDVHTSKDNLWNFLFFTGYLKAAEKRMEGVDIFLRMSIPNTEVGSVYRQSILSWFGEKVSHTDRTPLIKALEEGDVQAAESFVSDQLLQTISYFDYAENYYHGFLTGLLSGFDQYEVQSNRESGTGRPDLILKTPAIRKGKVIILELKTASGVADMEKKCREGLAQIEKKGYGEDFHKEGYPIVWKYAVCFYRKDCMFMGGEHIGV